MSNAREKEVFQIALTPEQMFLLTKIAKIEKWKHVDGSQLCSEALERLVAERVERNTVSEIDRSKAKLLLELGRKMGKPSYYVDLSEGSIEDETSQSKEIS